MSLLLCACASRPVSQARKEYANENYSKVIELLLDEKNLSESDQEMLKISEAHVMFDNGDHIGAVRAIADTSQGVGTEQFAEMYSVALTDAVTGRSADDIMELVRLDSTQSDAVYEALTAACGERDYNAYLLLDELIERLDDGDLRSSLIAFSEESEVQRAEALFIGTWERKSTDGGQSAKIKVTFSNGELVGEMIQVGSDTERFHFQVGDICWKDFRIENGTQFTYSGLVRYTDGTSSRSTATGIIDYKNGTIEVLQDGVVDPDKTWKRIGD